MTIDHEVEKIQMKFNDDENISAHKIDKKYQIEQVAKIQAHNDAPDEEMIRFEDEIIEEQHDHLRFQKGLQFFNKYEDKIDKDLVNQEYPDIV